MGGWVYFMLTQYGCIVSFVSESLFIFFNVTATNRLKIFPIILKLVNYAVIMCLF